MLDYGGQYSQLIARRVRECGVFSELLPHHVGAEEVARRRPKGVILSGGPGVGLRRGRAAAGARAAGARGPGAGHLLRDAAVGARARGPGRGRRGRRVRPLAAERRRQRAGCSPARPTSRPAGCRTATRCSSRRPGSPRWPPRPRRRSPPSSRASARSTASSSTPRSSTRPTASRCCTNFLIDICGCERHLESRAR